MGYVKIDIYGKDTSKALQDRKDAIEKHFNSKEDYKKFLDWLDTRATDDELGEKRLIKLVDSLIPFLKTTKKKLDEIEFSDMQKFKKMLLEDKIKKHNGEVYSNASKVEFTEITAKFFEDEYQDKVVSWKSGKKNFRKWFIIKRIEKTIEILNEKEVEKLINSTGDLMIKALLVLLFDGGFRAGEVFNIRFEDVIFPSQEFPYFRIDLKQEYSKTEGRHVGLYWKHSTDILNEYMRTLDIEQKEPIFKDIKYDNVRQIFYRLGLKALNKKIHFHQFRKSSATFYASKLNRQEMCVRYGWAFSSDMVDVYIKRSGIQEEGLKEKFLDTDISKLNKQNQELKTQIALLTEKVNNSDENILKKVAEMLSKARNEKVGAVKYKRIDTEKDAAIYEEL